MRLCETLFIAYCSGIFISGATYAAEAATIHDIEDLGIDNNPQALYQKGVGYRDRDQPEEALKWYLKAARLGHAEAQLIVGECYTWGQGTAKDRVQAFHWLLKAAEQNQTPAYRLVAECYRYGLGTAPDAAKADYWSQMSLKEQKKRIEAQTGTRIPDDITDATLMKHYVEAVHGNTSGMDDIAWAHFEGRGITKNKAQAIYWWKKAAELGDAQSQYNLGKCYEYGEGVPADAAEAKRWYSEADKPRNGQPPAYIKQESGNEDPTQGMSEETKTIYAKAQAGNTEAELKIAYCFYDGDGVARNIREARHWFSKAAAHGNETARRLLPKLQPMRRSYWRLESTPPAKTTKIKL